jgi:hypothetical protein
MNRKKYSPSINIFKYLTFSILAAFYCACSSAQNLESKVEPSKSFGINAKVNFADVDNLGRIYIVDEKNKLINYRPDLTEQYRYANTKSGLISSVDITNPLKIVAFYDDFNHVKILDNTLTIINEINLGDKFIDISACSTSNDGQLWVYDSTQFKLMKINENGQVLLETSNVNDIGMWDVNISMIKEKSNIVMLVDKSKGFYFFDNLGQYIFHFGVKDVGSTQFDGTNVIYYTSSGLNVYNIMTKENQSVEIPIEIQTKGLKYILYQSGNYYEVNQDGINVVKLVRD